MPQWAYKGALNSAWRGDAISDNGGRQRAEKLYPTPPDVCDECRLPPKPIQRRKVYLHRHHVDQNTRNNERSNIRWLCPKCHSAQHPVQKGTRKHPNPLKGARHHQAKLSESDVHELKALRATGMPFKDIAARFGITQTQACKINKGKAWRHLLS